MTRTAAEKVIDRTAIADAVAARRAEGVGKVVFTNGCFDILHVGHARYLAEARSLGGLLVVGLNSDASVRALKGLSRPVVSQDDRAELLAHLECVDMVCVFDEMVPTALIDDVAPDIHVKGGDYREEDLPEAATVYRHGGRIVIVPLVPGKSTTALLTAISAQPNRPVC